MEGEVERLEVMETARGSLIESCSAGDHATFRFNVTTYHQHAQGASLPKSYRCVPAIRRLPSSRLHPALTPEAAAVLGQFGGRPVISVMVAGPVGTAKSGLLSMIADDHEAFRSMARQERVQSGTPSVTSGVDMYGLPLGVDDLLRFHELAPRNDPQGQSLVVLFDKEADRQESVSTDMANSMPLLPEVDVVLYNTMLVPSAEELANNLGLLARFGSAVANQASTCGDAGSPKLLGHLVVILRDYDGAIEEASRQFEKAQLGLNRFGQLFKSVELFLLPRPTAVRDVRRDNAGQPFLKALASVVAHLVEVSINEPQNLIVGTQKTAMAMKLRIEAHCENIRGNSRIDIGVAAENVERSILREGLEKAKTALEDHGLKELSETKDFHNQQACDATLREAFTKGEEVLRHHATSCGLVLCVCERYPSVLQELRSYCSDKRKAIYDRHQSLGTDIEKVTLNAGSAKRRTGKHRKKPKPATKKENKRAGFILSYKRVEERVNNGTIGDKLDEEGNVELSCAIEQCNKFTRKKKAWAVCTWEVTHTPIFEYAPDVLHQ